MDKLIIAKYIRLSRDEAQSGSLSIENQRLQLDQFLSDNNMESGEVLEFVDNGFSGTNFERPAVQKLLELVREGKVACILVKDFSRFGRNAIETGYFIERVFPLFRVRFIAVDDGYDSYTGSDGSCGMEVAFKFLLNEQYSRDLSMKIHQAWRQKALRGERVSKGCVFGYKLDENRKMVIDPPAAETVRRIFEMFALEQSMAAIKERLYKDGHASPSMRKGERRAKARKSELSCVWYDGVIRSILRNEQYLGVYVAGKKNVVEVGSHRGVAVPKEDWIRIPGHHQEIIEQDLFDAVQRLLSAKSGARRKRKEGAPQSFYSVTSSLSGKVICGHCGHIMSLSQTKNAAFYCDFTRSAAKAACHKLRLSKNSIEESVLASIRRQTTMMLDADEESVGALSSRSLAASEYADRLEKLEREKQWLYEAFVMGEIDRNEYLVRKRVVDTEIERSRQIYEAILNETKTTAPDAEILRAVQMALNEDALTRAVVELLIEKVFVHPDHRIEIAWKHPCFAAGPQRAAESYVAN